MRPSGAITIPARPRPPGPRSGPPGLAGPIAAQLDRAHAALGSAPLAELLLILRDPAQRLAEGRAAPLSGAERRALGRLQPGVRGPLLSALRLLRLAGEEGGTAAFGRWLATYVEEVAARPRGAAVPHPEAPRRPTR
jgi:hypothetical protein